MDMNYEVKWKVGLLAAATFAEEARKYSSTIALMSRTGAWVKATAASEWHDLDLKPGSRVRLMIYGKDAPAATEAMSALFASKKPVTTRARPAG